jgi:RNA polymerase sigma-70 factor (ECF subfamily)
MSGMIDLGASPDVRADADAIGRVLAGETEAFAAIVQRYQGVLHRYALSMVLDHDEAADLVQDAFVRAYTSLASCRDHARFRAWLFRTLRHLCLDYLKNVRRRNVRLDEAEPVAVAAGGPGTDLEREQLRSDLRRALGELPDLQREAFMLRHVQGVPYEAMAELLDASVSALKMRVSRACDALQARLGDWQVTHDAVTRLSIRRG